MDEGHHSKPCSLRPACSQAQSCPLAPLAHITRRLIPASCVAASWAWCLWPGCDKEPVWSWRVRAGSLGQQQLHLSWGSTSRYLWSLTQYHHLLPAPRGSSNWSLLLICRVLLGLLSISASCVPTSLVYSHVCSFSCVQLFVTLWTVTHQAPLSMGFSRQEYWSGLPFSPSGVLPNPVTLF